MSLRSAGFVWLVFAVLIGLTILAAAAPPSEIVSVIHADKPFGAGRYRFLFVTAYEAQLWTDAPQWSMRSAFALTLRYHMRFSTDDMVSRSVEEMKRIDPSLDPSQLKAYGEAMDRVFPPVESGDEITALYLPGKPVRFFRDATATGEVSDPAFAKDFFGIWLSPRSTDPSLRKALLKLD